MINELSWKVGGQQGEGIESTGEIFSVALNRLGYYLYGYRHFSSRIRGGHTSNKIRVSTKPVHTVTDTVDILMAFDQETIDLDGREVRAGGIIVGDSKFNPQLPQRKDVQLLSVPLTEIAEQLGTSLMKNMVALGATAEIIGLPISILSEIVADQFSKKGQSVIDKNMQAIEKGAGYIRSTVGNLSQFRLGKADGKKRMFMIGNDAVALGFVSAGVRFMSAYPITPASEIMDYLAKKLPALGGAVIQTEDEIAAVTMAIGGNYGGVRTITASSGPGLSLMMEGIGLAGMTETPLVIVNTQRGGPSTGLPTKQEQSDINAMIYGTHGEIPKVVLAPSTVEEAFYDAVEACNIAEEYQVPVILLTDLQMALGKQTVEPLNFDQIQVRRGKLLREDQPKTESGFFKRFEFTESGVSPRVVPGVKNGVHYLTGNEHNEIGSPSEDPINRKKMMDKRLNKLSKLQLANAVIANAKHEEADVLLVGMGSTRGAIEEATKRLEKDGLKVNHVHVRLIAPFPEQQLERYIAKAKLVIVVENNATGQLADQLKLHVGQKDKIKSMLKYDGNPFLPSIVYSEAKELVESCLLSKTFATV